jgi:BirA family transcriptional regulator, biotin operon repressor / biotin---[acetyl-CoA-carboxylase] ligase
MNEAVGFEEREFRDELLRLGASPSRAVHLFEEIDSTSTELMRLMRSGASGGVVVVARAQRAGRGRIGRSWYSAVAGNLYLSVAVEVRGESPVDRLPLVPLAAGVGAVEVLREMGGARCVLKWPNDVLVDGRKIAGILCESTGRLSGPLLVAVGLGVNLARMEFPGELEAIASSLERHLESPPTPAALGARWVARFEELVGGELTPGRAREIIRRWKRLAEQFGRRVRIEGIEGTTKDVLEDGRLLVECDDGRDVVVSGGIVEDAD